MVVHGCFLWAWCAGHVRLVSVLVMIEHVDIAMWKGKPDVVCCACGWVVCVGMMDHESECQRLYWVMIAGGGACAFVCWCWLV